MLNIKEIALKVGAQGLPIEGTAHKFCMLDFCSKEVLIEFTEALIAEIAKQNEPVAEVRSLFPGEPDSYINARAIGVDLFNTWTFPQPGTKLYTSPPTAEQIANETTEAIASFVDTTATYDTSKEIAEAIRRGAWKAFK